jgi:hypothetical protein
MSVPDKGYSRNESCALLISMLTVYYEYEVMTFREKGQSR